MRGCISRGCVDELLEIQPRILLLVDHGVGPTEAEEDARLYLKKFVNAAKGNREIRADYVKAAQDKLFELGENPLR